MWTLEEFCSQVRVNTKPHNQLSYQLLKYNDTFGSMGHCKMGHHSNLHIKIIHDFMQYATVNYCIIEIFHAGYYSQTKRTIITNGKWCCLADYPKLNKQISPQFIVKFFQYLHCNTAADYIHYIHSEHAAILHNTVINIIIVQRFWKKYMFILAIRRMLYMAANLGPAAPDIMRYLLKLV